MLTPVMRPDRPLRVAVLSTRRAPGLDALLDDPGRGRWFDLVACLASDSGWRDLGRVVATRVPVVVHALGGFSAGRGRSPRDLELRHDYDAATAALLAPYRPDLLILCGYLHIVTAPLLDAYRDRVVNLHDADLTIAGADGLPRYRGLRSTRDAIAAGEPETRTTVHLVTPEVDVGPLVLRSWGFPVPRAVRGALGWWTADRLRAFAKAHRAWMMRAAWGPLLRETVALFAADQVTRRGRGVTVRGTPGPLDIEPAAADRPAPGTTVVAAAGAG